MDLFLAWKMPLLLWTSHMDYNQYKHDMKYLNFLPKMDNDQI
jgi:hypothetical protein